MKQKFNVTGMTCSACSAHVEKAVRQVEITEDMQVEGVLKRALKLMMF